MLSFQDKNLVTFRPLGFGFGICFFGGVTNEKGNFIVNNNGYVELGLGFRSRPELGSGKVPKNLSVGVEPFGTMLFPENKGFDVEVESVLGRRRRRRRRRNRRRVEYVVMTGEEIKVKRAAKERARPG